MQRTTLLHQKGMFSVGFSTAGFLIIIPVTLRREHSPAMQMDPLSRGWNHSWAWEKVSASLPFTCSATTRLIAAKTMAIPEPSPSPGRSPS